MKSYPSIDKIIRPDVYVYGQDKKDGTSIRSELSLKKGFHKFGTRNQLIDHTHSQFGGAVPLIKAKYEEALLEIFKEQRWQSGACFFEYFGPDSFAGNHIYENMDVVLFDVNIDKKGLLEAREFKKVFQGRVDTPEILFEGHVNSELVESVKNSTLLGMSLEGVVCKGPIDRKTKLPVMFKIKSQAWLDKLKKKCGDDEALFEKLA